MELTLPKTLPSEIQSVNIVDLRGKIPVNPKYTWESLKGLRDIENVTTLTFHHDALPKSKTAMYGDEELINRIANSHIKSTKNLKGGDPGFPYHGFVRNGTLYILHDVQVFTYGVASNNDYTVHLAVSGEYSKTDVLTEQDRNALYAGYFLFKQNMSYYKAIKGHGELNPSSCPGYSMDKVRNDLMTVEQEMIRNNSPEKQLEIAGRMANHLIYLNSLAQKGIDSYGKPVSEGSRKWALQQILLLEKPFRQWGWLK